VVPKILAYIYVKHMIYVIIYVLPSNMIQCAEAGSARCSHSHSDSLISESRFPIRTINLLYVHISLPMKFIILRKRF